MSNDWPLADPVFALQWGVHVAVASLFAILGVWWGTTRLPWYVPPTVLLALLWLFVPLNAPDPAVVLLIATPVLAAVCRTIRWGIERRGRVSDDAIGASSNRWRFRLSDSLWLTFLVGLGCALAVQLWRMPWPQSRYVPSLSGVYWPDIVVNAVSLIVLAAAVMVAMAPTKLGIRLLAAGAGLVMMAAVAVIHAAFVPYELLLMADWSMVRDNLPGPESGDWDVFQAYLRTFLVFTFLTATGLLVLGLGLPRDSKRLQVATRAVSGCVVALMLAGLAVVYIEIIIPPDWPAEDLPARNRRDELKSILARHADLNPQEWSVDDLRTSGGTKGQVAAQQVTKLFDELNDLLQSDEISLFDSRTDQPSAEAASRTGTYQQARSLSRALQAQAKADWAGGKRASVLKHDLLCLRLGAAMQRGSTSLDSLVGFATENTAMHHLIEIRAELKADEVELIASELQSVSALREPPDLLLARDAAYNARMQDWRSSLAAAAHRIQRVPDGFGGAWLDLCKRRDATLILLQTDLAIRSHQQQHGDWPEDLSQLVPGRLPQLPADPYLDERPLQYSTGEGEFQLYSAGPDRTDDGGQFGTYTDLLQLRRKQDFDLDTALR